MSDRRHLLNGPNCCGCCARIEELERQLADAIPLDAFKVPTDVLTADDPPNTAEGLASVKENETHG